MREDFGTSKTVSIQLRLTAFEVEKEENSNRNVQKKDSSKSKTIRPPREKGMSTFYHCLSKSENYKENPRNSTSTLWKSCEEVLKEVEKFNERISPEIKIISSNIEGPTNQHVNPVLTEEEESAMRDH